MISKCDIKQQLGESKTMFELCSSNVPTAKTTNCPEKQSSVNKARQDLLPMKDSGLPNTWVTLPSMVSARQDFFANKRFWASHYMGDSAFNGVSKYIARLLTGNAHCFHSFGDDLPYLIVHKREQCRYHYDYR